MGDERYPIGKFALPPTITEEMRAAYVSQIAEAPGALALAVSGLSEAQLDTPCRAGGWNVRQIVHHLPDIHLNAYVRFKLALTEDEPAIRPYQEARSAGLPEAGSAGIEISLEFLSAVHRRWIACIEFLPPTAFARRFRHPVIGVMSLSEQLALYAWHGRHHTAQIVSLRRKMGW